jgi:acyl-coenzyme A synthetase/AMP-(fatty) acid ligase
MGVDMHFVLIIDTRIYICMLITPVLFVCRILRNGSAFTYLNPECWDRNVDILTDLNIRWIFSQSDVHNCWTFRKEISVHGCTIALWENIVIETLSSVEDGCNQEEWRMAYTIQTSGTTGNPKIVRVPHRCIVPNIQSLQ